VCPEITEQAGFAADELSRPQRSCGIAGAGCGVLDVVVCTETIVHIIDDFRLMRAMSGCLKPGGRLLLTTQQLRRIPLNSMDYGPLPDFEDGRHVRRGYNRAILEELCEHAGMRIEEIGYASGPISQLHAWLLRRSKQDLNAT
jgi:hypothetical protein